VTEGVCLCSCSMYMRNNLFVPTVFACVNKEITQDFENVCEDSLCVQGCGVFVAVSGRG